MTHGVGVELRNAREMAPKITIEKKKRLSVGGGALPVVMSIIGPRETHDYRNYTL